MSLSAASSFTSSLLTLANPTIAVCTSWAVRFGTDDDLLRLPSDFRCFLGGLTKNLGRPCLRLDQDLLNLYLEFRKGRFGEALCLYEQTTYLVLCRLDSGDVVELILRLGESILERLDCAGD